MKGFSKPSALLGLALVIIRGRATDSRDGDWASATNHRNIPERPPAGRLHITWGALGGARSARCKRPRTGTHVPLAEGMDRERGLARWRG